MKYYRTFGYLRKNKFLNIRVSVSHKKINKIEYIGVHNLITNTNLSKTPGKAFKKIKKYYPFDTSATTIESILNQYEFGRN